MHTRGNKEERVSPWVIVAAAGLGRRFGGGVPKQFQQVGGQSLLRQTLQALGRCDRIQGMVVVVPPGWIDRDVLPEAPFGRTRVLLAEGGSERTDSVLSGLRMLPAECNLVLVHDGVRPAVSVALVERVMDCASRAGACVPVLPATETVKEVASDGTLLRTLDRERLRLAQTPQGFRRDVLEQAYRWVEQSAPGRVFPDDASLVEAAGLPVVAVEGDPENVKVTRVDDLSRLGFCAKSAPRVGYGYDVHRLVAGRRLVLGGVVVPHETGLAGHSDADVVLHALCDAVLGGAGLRDIGTYFPDDDPRFRDADSLELLRMTVHHARQAGWRVTSADLTVVAERPKIAPYVPQMVEQIALALGVRPLDVAVKAKTEEGLGFTGSLQGIAAHAIAVLVGCADGRT